MAGTPHADSASDKKLRSIYDCLDFGNNKKALQEADKVLKKCKDLHCAKALKALALIRLGRSEESFQLLQEVHIQRPTDEATLQAMSMCYREAGKLELVAELYDGACKVRPDNEELLTQLFMAYVRLGNYKKQQQTAVLLHKLRPENNPYLCWNVMSLVLQAGEADEKLAKTMFLPLAEKMLKKRTESGGFGSRSEQQLLLLILERLEKYDEAVEILRKSDESVPNLINSTGKETPLNDVKIPELLCRMRKWGEARAEYRQLIAQNPDAWSYYSHYFQSLFEEADQVSDTESVQLANAAKVAVTLINESVASVNGNENSRQRGPHIATMDLHRILKERSLDTSPLGSLEALVLSYCHYFGDKYCCFEDLARFWDFLDCDERSQVLSSLEKDVNALLSESACPGFASNVKVMQRHILLLQMKCRLSSSGTQVLNDMAVSSDELLVRYLRGISAEKEALATGLKTCDSYLLIGIFCLLEAWLRTQEQHLLLKACVWLEAGTRFSPANYHFKVLLIKVYSLLGAFSPVPHLVTALDVKHIQYDSVGYLFANDAVRWGHTSSAITLLNSALRFFTLCEREVNENLISCYRYGSFTKIEEFIKFRSRLLNSQQFASNTVDRLLIDIRSENRRYEGSDHILCHSSIDPMKETTDWSSLVDNRDFDILPRWTASAQQRATSLQLATFEEEKHWLKLRSLLSRTLAAAAQITEHLPVSVQVAGTSPNGVPGSEKDCTENSQAGEMAVALSSLLHEFDEVVRDYVQRSDSSLTFDPHGSSPTRMRRFLQLEHAAIFRELAHIVLHVHSLLFSKPVNDPAICNAKEVLLKIVADKFKESVGKTAKLSLMSVSSTGSLKLHPGVLEDSVLHAEMLAYLTVLMDTCSRIIRIAGAMFVQDTNVSQNRKGKKSQQPKTTECPNTLLPAQFMVGTFKQVHEQFKASAVMLENYLAAEAESMKTSLLAEHLSIQVGESCGTSGLDALPSCDACDDQQAVAFKDEQERCARRVVWANIEKSYQQSIKETMDLLKRKIIFFQELTF